MKKQKFTGKLSLNKETISRLQDRQMSQLNGGDGSVSLNSCVCTNQGNCTPTNYTCPATAMTFCNQITCIPPFDR